MGKITKIIDSLPGVLAGICNRMETDAEKELMLISTIGVLSGMVPKLKAKYRGDEIEANLYIFIYGDYGSGKGAMSYAKLLGDEVDRELLSRYKRAVGQYMKDKEIHKKDLAAWKKKKNDEDPPKPPDEPLPNMLFIPANVTKAALYEILQGTDGGGIIFETEGDTLVEALKTEHGGFSDLLRKAFHHESTRSYRKTLKELKDLEDLRFSVLLSATIDQLKKLIPSPENGLFSRFIYYKVIPNTDFDSVFSEAKNGHKEYLTEIGHHFFGTFFDHYSEHHKYFALTGNQQHKFQEIFAAKKAELMNEVDPALQGTANRFGIIAFRIMMILTAVRCDEAGVKDGEIECNDQDFDNAIEILNLVEPDILEVYHLLSSIPDADLQVWELRKKGKSLREIAKVVFGDEKQYQKVNRIMKKHGWR